MAEEPQPFPPPLKLALLGTIAVQVIFAMGGPSAPALRMIAAVMGSIVLVVQLVAVVVAIRLLKRGGYSSPANIAMTVVAALPLVAIVVIVVALILGFGRFHI